MSNINATITENNIIGIVEQPVNIIGNISNTNIEVTIELQKETQIIGQVASETKIEAIVMNGVKGEPFTYEDFTPEQLASLGTDKHYTHNQITSSNVWKITHNLGKYPSINVLDSAGNNVIGEIEYIDENSITINFSAEFTGKAYLN